MKQRSYVTVKSAGGAFLLLITALALGLKPFMEALSHVTLMSVIAGASLWGCGAIITISLHKIRALRWSISDLSPEFQKALDIESSGLNIPATRFDLAAGWVVFVISIPLWVAVVDRMLHHTDTPAWGGVLFVLLCIVVMLRAFLPLYWVISFAVMEAGFAYFYQAWPAYATMGPELASSAHAVLGISLGLYCAWWALWHLGYID